MTNDFDNARAVKETLHKAEQRMTRNRRRNLRAKTARAVAQQGPNRDWKKDRKQREEFACLTTLSLYRDRELSTEEVGRISAVRRPRRALRRLERLGLAKSVSGQHRGRYQALRGWQLVTNTPIPTSSKSLGGKP